MTLNIDALQEMDAQEEVQLGCRFLGSCCGPPLPWMPTFTIISCFGCTFTV